MTTLYNSNNNTVYCAGSMVNRSIGDLLKMAGDDCYFYMITIRSPRKKEYITKYDLDKALMSLKVRLPQLNVLQYLYETNGIYNQLHLHGIVSSPTRITYGKYVTCGPLRVQWTSLSNIEGLFNYLNKQVSCKDEQDLILMENISRHECLFDIYDRGREEYPTDGTGQMSESQRDSATL